MLIIRRGFSKERMLRLSAWWCLCDCINVKAVVVHSEHPMWVAQQKLLTWGAAFHHQQRYPSASTHTGAAMVPWPSAPIPIHVPSLLLATAFIRVHNDSQLKLTLQKIISAGFGCSYNYVISNKSLWGTLLWFIWITIYELLPHATSEKQAVLKKTTLASYCTSHSLGNDPSLLAQIRKHWEAAGCLLYGAGS